MNDPAGRGPVANKPSPAGPAERRTMEDLLGADVVDRSEWDVNFNEGTALQEKVRTGMAGSGSDGSDRRMSAGMYTRRPARTQPRGDDLDAVEQVPDEV